MSEGIFSDKSLRERTSERKWQILQQKLKDMKKAAVAFSGGVDSTFLLYAAHEALGDEVLALTVQCDWVPVRENAEAEEFCRAHGIRQLICRIQPDEVEGFCDNPPDRCYLCKKVLFSRMRKMAEAEGIDWVLDGSNMDDLSDYRPGIRALREMGIVSILQDAGLTKEEIRILSKEHGLSTWKKPSFACLASRFVYGERITKEKLDMVDRAEQKLMDLGFHQFRVRIHENLARIELLNEELERLMEPQTRKEVTGYLKELGFSYVTLDLMGYRSGSMNEVLQQNKSKSN